MQGGEAGGEFVLIDTCLLSLLPTSYHANPLVYNYTTKAVRALSQATVPLSKVKVTSDICNALFRPSYIYKVITAPLSN